MIIVILLIISFSNSGNITANTLNLSVAGDFDYGSDFLGNGNIDATTLNFQVGGDFSRAKFATTMQTIILFGMQTIAL